MFTFVCAYEYEDLRMFVYVCLRLCVREDLRVCLCVYVCVRVCVCE